MVTCVLQRGSWDCEVKQLAQSDTASKEQTGFEPSLSSPQSSPSHYTVGLPITSQKLRICYCLCVVITHCLFLINAQLHIFSGVHVIFSTLNREQNLRPWPSEAAHLGEQAASRAGTTTALKPGSARHYKRSRQRA